jgi:hypothetical protein
MAVLGEVFAEKRLQFAPLCLVGSEGVYLVSSDPSRLNHVFRYRLAAPRSG